MQGHELSVPEYEVHVEENVPIAMRDGTILRADIYQPQTPGRYPVLLERVAYELKHRCQHRGEYFARRGYIFVGQNVRGRYASEGRFAPFRDDAWGANQDGYDTIVWAGKQPWSNGKVGMLDGSYSGFTQYLLAPTRPPFLKALFVREGGSDVYRDFVFRGGAYQLALHRGWALDETWSALQGAPASAEQEESFARLKEEVEDKERWYGHLPLNSCPPLEGLAEWYFEDLRHPNDGPYWESMNILPVASEVDVPIFHLGGWFDCFLDSTLRAYESVASQGKTEACRKNQRLVIGPWIHGPAQVGERKVGELDFGPQAEFDLVNYWLRWYDYWLKGRANGIMDEAPVRVFLMGANNWLDMESWPPTNMKLQPMYLRQGTGRDATSLNNGMLTFEPPQVDESAEDFLSDPSAPLPSLLIYPQLGPIDHRRVEAEMLTYTSSPLPRDLTIVGPIKAVLFGMSSAPDTDWVVRLSDVGPDGRSLSVCDGILRARYRDSFDNPDLMEPGQVYRFEIDLGATAQVFKAGHALRVSIASSDFPRYDRNLQSGGTFGEETHGQVAHNTVFHDATRASHILLPVFEEI